MSYYPNSLEKLIKEFSKFPGIGQRSAEKLASYILQRNREEVENFCNRLLEVKDKIRFCQECFNLSEGEICSICQDRKRTHKQICVVEQYKDIVSIEKTSEFNGLYHVLMGHLSPIKGIGPDDLTINNLIQRIKKLEVEEIILATNPNVEGDATSLYIAELLKPYNLTVTRIARGLPVGGDLEFADPLTLAKSILKRENL